MGGENLSIDSLKSVKSEDNRDDSLGGGLFGLPPIWSLMISGMKPVNLGGSLGLVSNSLEITFSDSKKESSD